MLYVVLDTFFIHQVRQIFPSLRTTQRFQRSHFNHKPLQTIEARKQLRPAGSSL